MVKYININFYYYICNVTIRIFFQKEYVTYTSSHPLKCMAGDRPVIVVPLILYSDDTSGNKSKQWNKFDSWCVILAGLPKEENMKLENIYHISSSNKVYA